MKKLIDSVGYNFFNKNKNLELSVDSIYSICIVQPGHIGDLLLSIPMIDQLRKNFDGHMSLAVTSYTYELAKNLNNIDEIILIEHFRPNYLYNSKKFNIIKPIKTFKNIKSDVIFELRGDINIIIPLFLFSKYRFLVGFDVGGGGFLLDKVLPYPHHKHISETFYSFLEGFGVEKPKLKILDQYLSKSLENTLNIQNYVTIAIGTGHKSKEWDDNNFIKLIDFLKNENKKIVLLGKIEENRLKKYDNLAHDNVINLLNKTTIIEAISIIKYSDAFVGLDAGLTHAAAMLGVKTVAIYSAVNELNVWQPFNEFSKVEVVRSKLSCENCGLSNCNNNICMRMIKPEVVYQKLLEIL
ncbi:MAG: glycosyltransferase family 9 protein [Desulfurella sp.]